MPPTPRAACGSVTSRFDLRFCRSKARTLPVLGKKRSDPCGRSSLDSGMVFCGYATRGEQRSVIFPRFAKSSENHPAIREPQCLERSSVPAPCERFSLSLTRKNTINFTNCVYHKQRRAKTIVPEDLWILLNADTSTRWKMKQTT